MARNEETRVLNLRLLAKRSQQLAGKWIAHCLDLDVLTQGTSILDAFDMARDAIRVVVEDDLKQGLDPLDRSPAPEECWDEFESIIRHGRPLAQIPESDRDRITAVACMFEMRIQVGPAQQPAQPAWPPGEPDWAIPMWQVAALQSMRPGPDSQSRT